MPASFAHTLFGKELLKKFDPKLNQLIQKHLDYYYIGLFGPDILFYNQPLSHNDINSFGYQMHDEDAFEFFMNAKSIIKHSPYKEESLVYICGFINHFILDSECHGYIGTVEKESHLSHSEIESDFERELLQSKGLKASSTKLLKHIHYQENMAEVIAPFFGLSSQDIHESIKGMFFFLELLRCPSQLKRQVLSIGMKVFHVYDSMFGLIIHDSPNPHCQESTKTLVELFYHSIDIAKTTINDYIDHLDDQYLSDRFHRNFE